MRVAHSGRVKFEKSSKFANKLTRATRPEKGELCSPELIFVVLSLHTRSYISCKNQRLDLVSLAAMTSQM